MKRQPALELDDGGEEVTVYVARFIIISFSIRN